MYPDTLDKWDTFEQLGHFWTTGHLTDWTRWEINEYFYLATGKGRRREKTMQDSTPVPHLQPPTEKAAHFIPGLNHTTGNNLAASLRAVFRKGT